MDYKYHTFSGLKKIFLIPRYYIIQTVNLPFEFFKDLRNYFILHKNLAQENVTLKQLIKIQAARLQIFQSLELENIRLTGKINGAVGNYNAYQNIISIYKQIEQILKSN